MKKAKLLVVDDHQLFRKSLVSLLAIFPINLTLFEVGSGMEALETLKIEQIDIVLLDIQMPNLNGNDCLRKIKELHPQVRVIILTQFDEPVTRPEKSLHFLVRSPDSNLHFLVSPEIALHLITG